MVLCSNLRSHARCVAAEFLFSTPSFLRFCYTYSETQYQRIPTLFRCPLASLEAALCITQLPALPRTLCVARLAKRIQQAVQAPGIAVGIHAGQALLPCVLPCADDAVRFDRRCATCKGTGTVSCERRKPSIPHPENNLIHPAPSIPAAPNPVPPFCDCYETKVQRKMCFSLGIVPSSGVSKRLSHGLTFVYSS